MTDTATDRRLDALTEQVAYARTLGRHAEERQAMLDWLYITEPTPFWRGRHPSFPLEDIRDVYFSSHANYQRRRYMKTPDDTPLSLATNYLSTAITSVDALRDAIKQGTIRAAAGGAHLDRIAGDLAVLVLAEVPPRKTLEVTYQPAPKGEESERDAMLISDLLAHLPPATLNDLADRIACMVNGDVYRATATDGAPR